MSSTNAFKHFNMDDNTAKKEFKDVMNQVQKILI